MRTGLKKLGNQDRFTFTGEFVRTGFKTTYYGGQHCQPTLMLRNIKHDGQLVTNHLWFNYGKMFQKLGWLQVGDQLQFDARVDDYYKGFIKHNKHDYKLSRPTKIKRINQPDVSFMLPIDNPHALIGMILLENQQFYQNSHRGTDDDHYYIHEFKQWCKKHDCDWKIVERNPQINQQRRRKNESKSSSTTV